MGFGLLQREIQLELYLQTKGPPDSSRDMTDSTALVGTIPVDASFMRRNHCLASSAFEDDEATPVTGANALIMPATKKNKKKRPAVVLPEVPSTRMERRLSKSKARKLANVEVRALAWPHFVVFGWCVVSDGCVARLVVLSVLQIKRAKKEKRNDVIASLKQNELSLEQASLMKRSGSIGQRVTKKQTAKHNAIMKKLTGNSDEPSKIDASGSSASSSEDWSATESEEESDAEPATRKPFLAIQRPAPQPFSVPTVVRKEVPLPPPASAPQPTPKPQRNRETASPKPATPRVVKVPYVVPVLRSSTLQTQRMQLPVCQMEQEVA
jgi:hypothetical protein